MNKGTGNKTSRDIEEVDLSKIGLNDSSDDYLEEKEEVIHKVLSDNKMIKKRRSSDDSDTNTLETEEENKKENKSVTIEVPNRTINYKEIKNEVEIGYFIEEVWMDKRSNRIVQCYTPYSTKLAMKSQNTTNNN